MAASGNNDQVVDRSYFGESLAHWFRWPRSTTTDYALLREYGIPILASESDLATWLGISVSRLRWFTHDSPVDTTWHYVRYTRPKKRGGERVILAPKRELKVLQRKVLCGILTGVLNRTSSAAAHGFIPGRSIVTNARPHVGQCFVFSFDLENFFQRVDAQRVRNVFVDMGYSFAVSSTLTLLCTEYDRLPTDKDGMTVYASQGARHLPPGAPTSPALANLCCNDLDRTLLAFATERGLAYTRYADDLTFSGEDVGSIRNFVRDVAKVIWRSSGHSVNRSKVRITRDSYRQCVTGLVVNDQVACSRELRRRLRAILHNAQFTGLAAQNRDDHPRFEAYLAGQIAHVHAAQPAHAKPLRAQLARLRAAGQPAGQKETEIPPIPPIQWT